MMLRPHTRRPLAAALLVVVLPWTAVSLSSGAAEAASTTSVGRTSQVQTSALAEAKIPTAVNEKKKHKKKKRKKRKKTRVALRLAPATVTIGEPSDLVAQVKPRKSRVVRVQVRSGSTWKTVKKARTNRRGEFTMPLTTQASRNYRVAVQRARKYKPAKSRLVSLRALPASACQSQKTVDPNRTAEAACLVTRVDRWRASKLMGIGQQLNTGNLGYLKPVTDLRGRRPAVIGFDMEELDQSEYEYPFEDRVLADLLRLSGEGSILVAAWHAPNPAGLAGIGDFEPDAYETRWKKIERLLSDTPEADAFWADFDVKLDLFRRMQIGDADGDGVGGDAPRSAVVFRPFHEVNGDWFWWSRPDPAVYKRLYNEMQERAAAAGVHNIVWAYSFNYQTYSADPRPTVPWRVDIGGIDSYDPEPGRFPNNPQVAAGEAPDRLDMNGYNRIAASIPRMAITESGPHGSLDGNWNPATISKVARTLPNRPAWAMLWYDDFNPNNKFTGRKAIASLNGGVKWFDSCHYALCYVG